MLVRRILNATVALLLASSAGFAQDRKPTVPEEPSASEQAAREQLLIVTDADPVAAALAQGGMNPVAVPEGEGAWAVQAFTAGGILGTVRNRVVMTSAGNFSCDGTSSFIGTRLAPAVVQPLTQLVSALRPDKWCGATTQPTQFCMDCAYTTLILYRREASNQLRTHVVSWSDASAAPLPEEARRLRALVAEAAACR